MNLIYICSTYYHVLISCIKALAEGGSDIAVTEYISNACALKERLEARGLFHNVFLLATPKEYIPKTPLDKLFNLHQRNCETVSNQLSLDLSAYEEIYIFHDDTWVARYLKDAGIPYRIIEDALDSFKAINCSIFGYMTERGIKTRIKRALGYGYVFLDSCPLVQSIEVNDSQGLDFGCEIRTVPREEMFSALTEENKRMLADIFLPEIKDERALSGTLILTQPFSDDGVLSIGEQFELYKHLASVYNSPVIKPHPRDICDYSPLGCPMLPKDVPFEVIELCCQPHYSLAVAVSSTALGAIKCADKVVELGIDYLKK